MKEVLDIRIMAAFHTVIVAAVIVAAVFIVHIQEGERLAVLNQSVKEQEETLTELSVLTGRNAADAVVNGIIADCPRRGEFESLLSELATLSRADLLRTQQLFDSCADYYAELKSLMVFRMQREYEVLQDLTEMKLVSVEDPELSDTVKTWGSLVEIEKKRRDLLTEQVTIQGSIITSLIQGVSINNVEIRDQITRAQEIAELLSVHGAQVLELQRKLSIS
jgi:hypothetical protein